jgi:hypothetical protein
MAISVAQVELWLASTIGSEEGDLHSAAQSLENAQSVSAFPFILLTISTGLNQCFHHFHSRCSFLLSLEFVLVEVIIDEGKWLHFYHIYVYALLSPAIYCQSVRKLEFLMNWSL